MNKLLIIVTSMMAFSCTSEADRDTSFIIQSLPHSTAIRYLPMENSGVKVRMIDSYTGDVYYRSRKDGNYYWEKR